MKHTIKPSLSRTDLRDYAYSEMKPGMTIHQRGKPGWTFVAPTTEDLPRLSLKMFTEGAAAKIPDRFHLTVRRSTVVTVERLDA